jgi:hypothetical protein
MHGHMNVKFSIALCISRLGRQYVYSLFQYLQSNFHNYKTHCVNSDSFKCRLFWIYLQLPIDYKTHDTKSHTPSTAEFKHFRPPEIPLITLVLLYRYLTNCCFSHFLFSGRYQCLRAAT